MRHWSSLGLLSLTGCSLIYNPSNLPEPRTDALEPDMMVIPVDADPALLEVTDVGPLELLEGAGIDGSRRALVVVSGANMVQGATVAITAHAGEAGSPLLTVHNEEIAVSTDGITLVVPVTVDVDPLIGPAPALIPSIRLDVAVTQPTPGDPITKIIDHRGNGDDAAITLRGLKEQLGGGTLTINLGAQELYSKIEAKTVAFTGNAIPIIEAVSSIKIEDPISVDANGQTAGFGGGNGGAGGPGGLVNGSPGSAGTGTGRGSPSGGGGSFGTQGVAGPGAPGDTAGAASLPTLESPNRGSGGAGGDGGALNAGGTGGGGGGTIAITAGGELSFGGISAKGGPGTSGSMNGGGGSGGAVLLRAGKSITVLAGGAGVVATGGTSAGAGVGGNGRVRIDAGTKVNPVASNPPVGHRGAMIDIGTPVIVRDQTPSITFNGQPDTQFSYTIEDVSGLQGPRGPIAVLMPTSGQLVNHSLGADLFRGLSLLCVRVQGADGSAATGKNCVTIGFVP